MIRCSLLLLMLLGSCAKEETVEIARPVRAIQVKDFYEEDSQVIFPGTLRAFKRADLSFRVDGIVLKRDITVGQKAKKDDILIRLDPREYEIALQKAKGKVESTQAQLDFASRDYDRMKKIYETDPGAISASLLDRKKENSNQLKADLTVAQSDLDKALDDLSYTNLKAPFDGIIAAIYVENHEQIRAKQAVMRFLDIFEREMEINVPEKLINALLEGRERLAFTVYLDAFPGKAFPAAIKEIGTEASSTTQTYAVILTLQEVPAEISLLAGMSGRAVLQVPKGSKPQHAFKVPKSAVFTENLNKFYVWVVDPKTNTVQKKSVVLDQKSRGDFALILEGVSAGDWVVTAGTSFLSEGQKVKFDPELTQ